MHVPFTFLAGILQLTPLVAGVQTSNLPDFAIKLATNIRIQYTRGLDMCTHSADI